MSDITIVVPTFNDGELLDRCLASIAAQSLPPAEVILVDDGSTDPDSRLRIESAAASCPRVTLIRQPNAGPSAARNRGLAACRTSLTAFVDADDELPRESLAERLALLEAHPGATAAYGAIEFVEPDGRRWRSSYRDGAGPLPNDAIGDRDGVPGFLWAYLVRTVALRAAGGFNERLRIMEDFDLLARLGQTGAVVVGGRRSVYVQHRRPGSLARGSAFRQMAGAMRFLAEARRRRYFSGAGLLRRYARVPIGGLKVLLLYGGGRRA